MLWLFWIIWLMVTPQASPSLIQQIESHLQSYQSLQARFEQTYTPVIVSEPSQESGRLYYRQPGLMRWEYSGREKRIYLIKDNILWEYLPEENQLIIYDLSSEEFNQTLLNLLSGQIDLAKDYQISVAESSSSRQTRITLLPHYEESEYRKIEIEIDTQDFLLRTIKFTDWSGNKTDFKFKDIKINRPLKKNLFQLEVPESTEIIDYRQK